jgi:hypothetical protein
MSDTSNVNSIDDYRAGRRAVSKLSTDMDAISQALEVYEEGGDNWTPSFIYGYLDGISLKLQHLIDEIEAEKIDIPVTTKEDKTNDGRESEEDGREFDWRYDKSTDSFVRTEGDTGHDECSIDPESEADDI